MSNKTDKSRNRGYEQSDAKVHPIFWAGLGLFILMLVGFLVSYLLFGYFSDKRGQILSYKPPLAAERQLPSGPRLQVNPEQDLQNFRAGQDSLLNTYGWIQRDAGVVRIPVDAAIQEMLKLGFPVRENPDE